MVGAMNDRWAAVIVILAAGCGTDSRTEATDVGLDATGDPITETDAITDANRSDVSGASDLVDVPDTEGESDTVSETGRDAHDDLDADSGASDSDIDADTGPDLGCPGARPGGVGPTDLPSIQYPPALRAEWEYSGAAGTSSSPVFWDLNSDGVLDLILGFGEERRGPEEPALGSLVALDGATGEVLWATDVREELFTRPRLVSGADLCSPHVVVGGRAGELNAFELGGSIVWRFNLGEDPRTDGLFNFYTPQLVPDADGDGEPDILVANGGDSLIDAGEPRPPGQLMVIGSASGTVVARAMTPDGAETYSSLTVGAGPDGGPIVYFGTGGETNAGALWAVELAAVTAEELSPAVRLYAPELPKGVIAPPSLADLNADGVVDVVAAAFDGTVVAFDGASRELLWSVEAVELRETYSAPGLAQLDGDGVPDPFFAFSVGQFPEYAGVQLMALSGSTGDELWSFSTEGVLVNSPIFADLDGDGLEEALLQVSRIADGRLEHRPLVVRVADGSAFYGDARPGAATGTGAVIDLDGDGRVEWIATSRRFFEGRESWVWRIDLSAVAPSTLHWSGYLGADGTGRYEPGPETAP